MDSGEACQRSLIISRSYLISILFTTEAFQLFTRSVYLASLLREFLLDPIEVLLFPLQFILRFLILLAQRRQFCTRLLQLGFG